MEILVAVLLAALVGTGFWVFKLTSRVSQLESMFRGESGPSEEMIRPIVQRIQDLSDDAAKVLRRSAVVRYDAFGDTSGNLSFSAALLNDRGDGLVITTLNGRSESRTYAKVVMDRASEQKLSTEEQDAITKAMRS